MKFYKSYNFRDKDPVIDRVRTILQDQGVTYQYVENKSGVTDTTLRNWFQGKTRRPQHATVAAVLGCLGYDLLPVKRADTATNVVPIRPAKPAKRAR